MSNYLIMIKGKKMDYWLNNLDELNEIKNHHLVKWDKISKYENLTIEFIKKFKDKIYWNNININNKNLNFNFINEFINNFDFDIIIQNQKITDEFIFYFFDILTIKNWINISKYQKLSENFIINFKDKINWKYISENQILSENFIIKYHKKINWKKICKNQKLSETFIEKYKNNVYWDEISKYQKLSELFITKFKDKVTWKKILKYQNLSNNFLKNNITKINICPEYTKWDLISQYQKINEDFIRDFKDKFDWGYLSEYQTLSSDFINEFKERDDIDWFYIIKYQKLKEEHLIIFEEYYGYYIESPDVICQLSSEEYKTNSNYWEKVFKYQKNIFSDKLLSKLKYVNPIFHIDIKKRNLIGKFNFPFDICIIINSFY